MDDQTACDIANKVVHDTSSTSHLSASIGAALGSVLTILGNYLTQHMSRRAEFRRDQPRRRVLMEMLEDDRFFQSLAQAGHAHRT